MEFNGTKGKWVKVNGWNRKGYYHKVTADNVSICNITTRNESEAEANAKLIESAPEMFEMLKKIVLMTETCQGTFLDFRERYNIEINELLKKITQ